MHFVLYTCLRTFLQLVVAILQSKRSKRVKFSQLTHLMPALFFYTH